MCFLTLDVNKRAKLAETTAYFIDEKNWRGTQDESGVFEKPRDFEISTIEGFNFIIVDFMFCGGALASDWKMKT